MKYLIFFSNVVRFMGAILVLIITVCIAAPFLFIEFLFIDKIYKNQYEKVY